jgi:hypothetical protein
MLYLSSVQPQIPCSVSSPPNERHGPCGLPAKILSSHLSPVQNFSFAWLNEDTVVCFDAGSSDCRCGVAEKGRTSPSRCQWSHRHGAVVLLVSRAGSHWLDNPSYQNPICTSTSSPITFTLSSMPMAESIFGFVPLPPRPYPSNPTKILRGPACYLLQRIWTFEYFSLSSMSPSAFQ